MQTTSHAGAGVHRGAVFGLLFLAAQFVPAQTAPAAKSVADPTITLEKVEIVDTKVDGLINKGLLQTGENAPVYHMVIDREEIEALYRESA